MSQHSTEQKNSTSTSESVSISNIYERELQFALESLCRVCRVQCPSTERSLFLLNRISGILHVLKRPIKRYKCDFVDPVKSSAELKTKLLVARVNLFLSKTNTEVSGKNNPTPKVETSQHTSVLSPPPVLYSDTSKPRKRRWDVRADDCLSVDQLSKRKTRWDR